MNKEFNDLLYKKTEKINEIISEYMPKEGELNSELVRAMNYAILAGGKKLRPMLVLEFFKLFGEDEKRVYPFMAAIEMIHTYSLIHDDLPAIDNDMVRRGLPTVHAKFGEATAILAGDGLLNAAAECGLDYTAQNPTVENIRALQVLFEASGYQGMIGGQSVDVSYEKSGKEMELNILKYIYDNKTGALIRSAMEMGAIIGGASKKERELVREIGTLIGEAFQIRDDILDITSTEEVLGKPIGSDAENKKTTMAVLLGIEESEKRVDELSQQAIESLMTLPGDKSFLKELFLYLSSREK